MFKARFSRLVIWGCACLLGCGVACSRKAEMPQPPAALPTGPDTIATAPPDASKKFPIHQELTEAYHNFILDAGGPPPSFEALVEAKYLKALPVPPDGGRFALDRKHQQVVVLPQ